MGVVKKAACYCRVSTKKEEQLQSLEMQKQYFTEYCEKNAGYELYGIYADEGISGKSLKNRKEFDRMTQDSKRGCFNVILVKDFARFARNTVDLLTSIRALKEQGIEVLFVNYNMTSFGDSEFIVTLMAAIAQEESAMLSKKLKLSKNITAKQGRVPNFAFGYEYSKEKKALIPKEEEAKWVRRIFEMYVNDAVGTAKVAEYLNNSNVITKKNISKGWTQHVISCMLRNELYIGKVNNKKSEIIDFKTGKRKEFSREDWLVAVKPELRIVDDELFSMAQKILDSRKNSFSLDKKRPSSKYPLSNLMVCKNDGYSFRRCSRKYSDNGKTYQWWTCSYRNATGISGCRNGIRIDEDQMHIAIIEFFQSICRTKEDIEKQVREYVGKELQRRYEYCYNRKELLAELRALETEKSRLINIYTKSIISEEEFRDNLKPIAIRVSEINTALNLYGNYKKISSNIEKSVTDIMKSIEVKAESLLNNVFLKTIFEKFEVYEDGKIRALINIDYDSGLSVEIPFGEMVDVSNELTVPEYNNHTQGCNGKTCSN